MIMCVLLCYPVSIRTYYQQGVLFLVLLVFSHVANFRYVANFRFLTLQTLHLKKMYFIPYFCAFGDFNCDFVEKKFSCFDFMSLTPC